MEETSVIKNMGILAEDAYNSNFFSGLLTETRVPGYEVLATSPESDNGFQALLLEKVDPNTAGSQYVITFRGTEGTNPFTLEFWRDLILTDVLKMGSKEIPAQFIEALFFVNDMQEAYGLTAGNTTLTGHSLGGAIATAMTYAFGFQTYGYNPFGIAESELFTADTMGEMVRLFTDSAFDIGFPPSLADIYSIASYFQVDQSRLSEFLNSTEPLAGNVTDIVNIVTVGKDVQEFVSGTVTNIVGGLIGEILPVLDQSGGGLLSHSIEGLNQSIAVYNNLLVLFPQQGYSSLTATLAYIPGDDPVRSFLLALGGIVAAGNLAPLDTVAMAQQLTATGTTNLQLFNLADKDLAYLNGLSENKAELYALLHLNTFVVQGDNLPAYQDLDPATISEQYIEDRARFLYQLLHPSQSSHEAYPIQYTDVTTQNSIWAGERTTLFDNARYTFGSEIGNTLPGQSKDDHLYGMDGNDTLLGLGGNDYLEGGSDNDILAGGVGDDTLIGGAGNDLYLYTSGDGHDTLVESRGADGLLEGTIRIDDGTQTITVGGLFSAVEGEPSTWSDLNGVTLVHGATWQLLTPGGGSIDLGVELRSGDYGIVLEDSATEPEPIKTIRDIYGDRAPLDIDPYTEGDQFGCDDIGNVINDPNRTESLDDSLYDSAGNDHIMSGTGDDTVHIMRGGNDIIDLGDGDDKLYTYPDLGPPGNLIINGGAGRDYIGANWGQEIIEGGPGADAIYGASKDDLFYGDEEGDAADFISQGASESGSGLQGEWINGRDGDDQIFTGADNDLLAGGDGNDLIVSGGGSDYIAGDWDSWSPSDWRDWTVTESVSSDGQSDTYSYDITNIFSVSDAGSGNDTIYAGAGDDVAMGERGNDTIYLEAGNDKGWGGEGGDTILGGAGNDLLQGDNSLDLVAEYLHGDDFLDGGDGSDKLFGDGGADIIYGGAGDDLLFGDSDDQQLAGDDYLNGEAGNDTLNGGGGMDTLLGGEGDDRLYGDSSAPPAGQQADDYLDGGAGNDLLIGAAGADILFGGDGADQLFGDADNIPTAQHGDDYLAGGTGNDQLVGGDGDDFLSGDEDDDLLWGGEGKDTLNGGLGSDYLEGGAGNDVLNGDAESDTLFGGEGDDVLSGGAGGDFLTGGSGNDTLKGGAGQDTYFYQSGDGRVSIVDEGSNTLSFGASITASDVSLGLGSLLIRTGVEGDEIHIENFNPAAPFGQIAVDRFEFADGTVLAYEQLLARGFDIVGSAGNDLLTGTSLHDRINGGAGDDFLNGGAGDDTLRGEDGNDTYLFSKSSGQVVIEESAGDAATSLADRIRFVDGITADELSLSYFGPDLHISVAGAAGSLILKNWLQDGPANQIEWFDFDTTPSWDQAAIVAAIGDGNTAVALGSMPEDGSLLISAAQLLANSPSSADGSLSVVNLAADSGSVIDYGSGTWIYQPDANAYGPVNFSYSVSDGVTAVMTTATLDVTAVNDFPVAGNWVALGSVSEDSSRLLTDAELLANVTDVDGDSLSVAHLFATSGSVIANGDGTWTYQPAPAVYGPVIFRIGVSDGNESWFTYTIATLEVKAANDAPIVFSPLADQSATPESLFSYEIPTGSFRDLDTGDSLSYNAIRDDGAALPSWLSFDAATGIFSGTPASGDVGTLDIKVIATDTGGLSVADIFVLTIKGGAVINVIIGTEGNDTLIGSAGDDLIDGGAGIDVMAGDSGNDVYYVDGYAEVTVIPGNDGGNPGQGQGSGRHRAHDKNHGIGNSRSRGNEGVGNGVDFPPPGHTDNWNDGPGTGRGYPGPQVQVADQIITTYVTDSVSEEVNGGYDRIYSTITYGLTENVEELILTGSDNLDGTGNGLDNRIVGNAGNNRLVGGLGADSLQGGEGDDTYLFNLGDGDDTVFNDHLTGVDRILFGDAVAPTGVALLRSGDHLEIGYGLTDRVTVDNFFNGPETQVDAVHLANGSLLTAADIDAIVQQMSAYAVQEGIALSSLDSVRQNDSLMTLVAGSWHAAA